MYTTWPECKKQVRGYKGAIYKVFATEEEPKAFVSTSDQEKEVICCSSCFGKDGTRFASVIRADGKDLLCKYHYLFTDVKMQEAMFTSGRRNVIDFNDGNTDLLAMYAALLIATNSDRYKVIWSDSELLVDYWSKKLTPKKAQNMHPDIVSMIYEVIRLRKEFTSVVMKVAKDDYYVTVCDLPQTGF